MRFSQINLSLRVCSCCSCLSHGSCTTASPSRLGRIAQACLLRCHHRSYRKRQPRCSISHPCDGLFRNCIIHQNNRSLNFYRIRLALKWQVLSVLALRCRKLWILPSFSCWCSASLSWKACTSLSTNLCFPSHALCEIHQSLVGTHYLIRSHLFHLFLSSCLRMS